MSTRPPLVEVPLPTKVEPGELIITIDVGAWDMMIKACYEGGAIVVEMDENEKPVRAFQKPEIMPS